jgi:hypothetical protein
LSTVSNGTYHLEEWSATESQTRLAGQEGLSVISKPRRMQGGESIYIYLPTPRVDRCRCLVMTCKIDR